MGMDIAGKPVPQDPMPKLPSLNLKLQNDVSTTPAKPVDIQTSLANLQKSMTPRESNFGFDLKKFMLTEGANNLLSSFTSGINDRRVKKSQIQNAYSNIPYTSLGSDTSRYGYGYAKFGGLLRPNKMKDGGFLFYDPIDKYMYDEENDDDNDYFYDNQDDATNVSNYQRLDEEDVQNMSEQEAEEVQQAEQAQLEEEQSRQMRQQRRARRQAMYENLGLFDARKRTFTGDDDEEEYYPQGNISIPANKEEQFNIIKEVAERYGVPASVLAGVYGAETGFGAHPTMVSSAGAQGPFQFMPGTAAQYGVNPWDFNQAADGAARLLRDNFKILGSWPKAVAAYNTGAGNVKKGIIPQETQAYVPKVMGYANMFSQKGFQKGGTMLNKYQTAGQYPRPTTQDSINLMNASKAYLDYYKKKGYRETAMQDKDVNPSNLVQTLDKTYNDLKKKPHKIVYPTKSGTTAKGFLPLNQYRQDVNEYQFKQREPYDGIIDTRAPMPLYDRRIKPQIVQRQAHPNILKHNMEGLVEQLLFMDYVPTIESDLMLMATYDPIAVKPVKMRTKEDWEYLNKRYGTTIPITPPPPLPSPPLNTHPITKMKKISLPKQGKVNIKGVPLTIPQSQVTLNFDENDFIDDYQTPRFAIYDQQGNMLKQGDLQQTNEFQRGGLKQYQRAGSVKQNPPITYTQEQFNSDPVLRQNVQNYRDSLNLYNAYQFQKQNVNPTPMLRDMVQNLTNMGHPTTVEELRRTRQTNLANNQVAKNENLKRFRNYNEFKREDNSELDPMDRRVNDNKIYDYFKSLQFYGPTFIGKYSSPDLIHKTIKPVDAFYDGIAYSPVYKQPVQPYLEQHDYYLGAPSHPQQSMPFLQSTPRNGNRYSFAPAQKINIPTPKIQYAPIWETKVYDTPAYRSEWKEQVMKPISIGFKKGGSMNTTGYTPGYSTYDNDYNLIPSTSITMKDTPFDVIGIDSMGYTQYMKPGGNYSFMRPPVLEIPAYKTLQQGGIQIAPEKRGTFKAMATRMGLPVQSAASKILNAPEGRYSPEMRRKANFAKNFAKKFGGVMSAPITFPRMSQNKNDSYKDSLTQYKRGDVYYVDTATLANLKTANVKFKHI